MDLIKVELPNYDICKDIVTYIQKCNLDLFCLMDTCSRLKYSICIVAILFQAHWRSMMESCLQLYANYIDDGMPRCRRLRENNLL